ncbi:lipopolysaccharide biosynthesis protein rffA [Olsenella sp. oral taxon 809 str. F0356]|uniref:dTDP-4-amino-4,6-dideoxygalactose transaminase n=1 Tax=Olsenella sp. oral taxon 809 TaxID=661086 RepID=UPI000231EE2A|nr:dTDP-4-amino-4,6-dideoxygalactose transaminase [Olsenella sp. oral taxon 809]EHF01600.1 lipopolysaccharide biosynthesis protein rffA [Olsenella sp. oral taxon 809 str. F0356]
MIDFNVPPYVGTEMQYVREAAERNHKICGDGPFSLKCHKWMEERFGAEKVLLTTSGTSALEMAAVLCDLEPGDEVILPSFTFSSTATAFQAVGATLVFVDIRPDTMNMDEERVESAITERTRVIVPVHYAGVSCEMDRIMDIARRHGLLVVEDAAQGVMSSYHGRALGTIGTFGCYSFHETKNYSMGEGGAIVINDPAYIERAEIIREKGTNRQRFFRGQVDKYTWVDRGSSYLQSDLNAAYLWGQLQAADQINDDRLATWHAYRDAFAPLAEGGLVELPVVPEGCVHNAHMFYLKCRDLGQRQELIAHLKKRGVMAVFHYIPLHSSPAGLRFGRFDGEDLHTTRESERLVRLPLYFGMSATDRAVVIRAVLDFFE